MAPPAYSPYTFYNHRLHPDVAWDLARAHLHPPGSNALQARDGTPRLFSLEQLVRELHEEGRLVCAQPGARRHEHDGDRGREAAAHAADGYARVSRRTGVCVATSGPGATNLVTGIATAYMDSVPMVVITGNVGRDLLGRDGFQEADITGITMPITKHNFLVMRAREIAQTVREAFHIASTGRKGPVLIDIPKDVFIEQAEFVDYPKEIHLRGYPLLESSSVVDVQRAAELINQAEKPIILAGRGVLLSDASAELISIAEKTDIPVITTLLGISCFPENHRLSYGGRRGRCGNRNRDAIR